MGLGIQLPTEEDLLCLECVLPDCNDRDPECRFKRKRLKVKEYNHEYYMERREGWNT